MVLRNTVATVLTVYGIETHEKNKRIIPKLVATVLTVYGIETLNTVVNNISNRYELQQCLPFTVLKHYHTLILKSQFHSGVATVLTVYGIETSGLRSVDISRPTSCNSAYRLRY